jgi:hypothetical protein
MNIGIRSGKVKYFIIGGKTLKQVFQIVSIRFSLLNIEVQSTWRKNCGL